MTPRLGDSSRAFIGWEDIMDIWIEGLIAPRVPDNPDIDIIFREIFDQHLLHPLGLHVAIVTELDSVGETMAEAAEADQVFI